MAVAKSRGDSPNRNLDRVGRWGLPGLNGWKIGREVSLGAGSNPDELLAEGADWSCPKRGDRIDT